MLLLLTPTCFYSQIASFAHSILSALVLWRGALWLSLGFAALVLATVASRTLSAPAPAAQQPGPAAPQATQPAPQSPSPQTPPAGQAKPAQALPPAPGQPPPGPTPPAAPPQTPPVGPTTPASQAPPAAPAAAAGGAGVGFRLDNADLLQFVNLVAGELKLNYVVDPAVKGVVTISTAGDLKPEDLLPILETVLKMNGATAVKTGNFYRIVPLAAAPKNPLGISTNPNGASLPEDDRMLMQIIPLKFVFAADMAKMLSPFLSEGGTVAVHEAANTLILVDDSLNVKRLMEILQQFDNSSFAEQRVRLIPVHNNVASALVPELEAIFSTYALSEKETPLRFVPLDHINGILVAAADPAAFDEVERWMAKLDQPAAPTAIQTFVYKVQNSEADRLVRLLNALRGTRRRSRWGTAARPLPAAREVAGGDSRQPGAARGWRRSRNKLSSRAPVNQRRAWALSVRRAAGEPRRSPERGCAS